MKKLCLILFSVLLCALCVCAQAAPYVPDGMDEAFTASRWDNYEYVCSDTNSAATTAAVVMTKNGRYSLCILKYTGSKWKMSFYNDAALWQGSDVSINGLQFDGDGAFEVYYDDDAHSGILRFAMNQQIWRISRITRNSLSPYETITVYSDKLIFSSDSTTKTVTVEGTTSRDLQYFSLSNFPLTVEKARASLSVAPTIPSGTLTAERIQFTGGQKYDVYSGPGTNYLRSANGKAAVSTNDWIQVFGQTGNWILIQYDISGTQKRIGYISSASLPKNANVKTLSLSATAATITSSTTLTDDPLGTQASLRSLSSGNAVTWLATMGEWAYVEVSGTTPVRGFVRSSYVQVGTAEKTYTAQRSYTNYTATATVTAKKGESLSAQISAVVPSAWLSTNVSSDVDYLIGYQLYLNNVGSVFSTATGTAGSTVYYSINSSLPANITVVGLVPVYSVSGVHAEDALSVYLN